MSEANKAVVLKFIEAMGSNDGETAATCVNADAYTMVKGNSKFAGPRSFDTIVETINSFTDLIPTGLRPTILTVTAEGERVAVEFDGHGICSNGAPYENHYCMVFTMKDGRIQQVNEYFCTQLADTVLWPLVEAWMNKSTA